MSESTHDSRPAAPASSPGAPPPRAVPDLAIRIHQLGKCYPMYNKPADRLKQALWLGRRKYYHDFWALKDVSFEVPRGRTVGIMGRNGSGKSTLLQIVAGTLSATCGTVEVRGRASALLELGAGFVPDLTGRENIYVYGTLTGLSRKEIDARFDAIAAFADIGEFIDQPVKIYSSGMFVRLAFSAAVNVDPDVLIIDEALAVGDARFQSRCMNKINQFRESGVSILFVSHDMETIKRICDHALVLDRGQVVSRGVSVHATNWYLAFLTNDFDLEKTRQAEREAAAQVQAPEAATPAATWPRRWSIAGSTARSIPSLPTSATATARRGSWPQVCTTTRGRASTMPWWGSRCTAASKSNSTRTCRTTL